VYGIVLAFAGHSPGVACTLRKWVWAKREEEVDW
jgi:hypothetical protein